MYHLYHLSSLYGGHIHRDTHPYFLSAVVDLFSHRKFLDKNLTHDRDNEKAKAMQEIQEKMNKCFSASYSEYSIPLTVINSTEGNPI